MEDRYLAKALLLMLSGVVANRNGYALRFHGFGVDRLVLDNTGSSGTMKSSSYLTCLFEIVYLVE